MRKRPHHHSHRPWPAKDLRFLRDRYADLPAAEVARRLGRSLAAVRSKARKLGVRRREFWSGADLALLRKQYGRVPTRQLARALGRPAGAVHQKASKEGLCFQHRALIGAHALARIRELNALGWPDVDIARDIGCERHTASRHRKAMGLPSHEKGEVFRGRVREAARRQCERAGVASLGQLRVKVHRERARAAGWPEDLRPRHVQILELLAARGPMTRPEIAAALGMPWRGTRNSLKSNDPEGTYLAHLVRRRLVACVTRGRQVVGRGRGHSLNTYLVPVWVTEAYPFTSKGAPS